MVKFYIKYGHFNMCGDWEGEITKKELIDILNREGHEIRELTISK